MAFAATFGFAVADCPGAAHSSCTSQLPRAASRSTNHAACEAIAPVAALEK